MKKRKNDEGMIMRIEKEEMKKRKKEQNES